jgi:hypothetical protein
MLHQNIFFIILLLAAIPDAYCVSDTVERINPSTLNPVTRFTSTGGTPDQPTEGYSLSPSWNPSTTTENLLTLWTWYILAEPACDPTDVSNFVLYAISFMSDGYLANLKGERVGEFEVDGNNIKFVYYTISFSNISGPTYVGTIASDYSSGYGSLEIESSPYGCWRSWDTDFPAQNVNTNLENAEQKTNQQLDMIRQILKTLADTRNGVTKALL